MGMHSSKKLKKTKSSKNNVDASSILTLDIELEKQRRLLQESNRLKNEFLSNMSHELRSPLNGIIGFAELMHSGKVGPMSAEHKEYLKDILTSSQHLLQLINDVIDLAKVDSGKMEFFPKEIDLNIVIAQVCDILRTFIAKNKIRLTTIIDERVTHVITDPAKLKQIIYHFISNALKNSKEGGIININVIPEGTDYFKLEVEDNGIGIREEDIPKLFTEFQKNNTNVDNHQETGLGLALSKKIAQAQGGQVGVQSIFNKGSTFFAILPRLLSAKPGPSQSNVVFMDSGLKSSARILVIEDNIEDNAFIATTLINAGYAVEVVFNGEDAIKICQEQSFDTITLDLILPDMNGWDVLRTLRMKGLNLETPAIVITTIGNKAASFGFMIQNFLIKPIKSADLILALQQTGVFQEQNNKILFVDDDPHMLMLCKRYMKNYGSTLFFESDPKQALIVTKNERPDVIVLDLLMPGMDGFDFLRALRKKKYGMKIPVIICTSQDISAIDKTRLKASVASVVEKGDQAIANLIAEIKSICPIQ